MTASETPISRFRQILNPPSSAVPYWRQWAVTGLAPPHLPDVACSGITAICFQGDTRAGAMPLIKDVTFLST
ncbi:hypothetical protein E2C01_006390 [Portunus trituberculatus]|uniref:Uncharacterized protein n=1 Tax=Portunus trituberculatus TaxID=210409 RepID=A0A5B7CWR5_PORTR|nr:hypothetical protein [Portunus trituberculatus]